MIVPYYGSGMLEKEWWRMYHVPFTSNFAKLNSVHESISQLHDLMTGNAPLFDLNKGFRLATVPYCSFLLQDGIETIVQNGIKTKVLPIYQMPKDPADMRNQQRQVYKSCIEQLYARQGESEAPGEVQTSPILEKYVRYMRKEGS
ncbi:hypothetical protein B7463_g12407, partial [Scytalidium lignicola]